MCLKGCDTSTPPACSTNPAGEKELPWQTHTMLISAFVYLYKNPVIVFPFGPFPVVETHGICSREGAEGWWFWFRGLGGSRKSPFPSLAFFRGLGGLSPVDELRLVVGSLTGVETFSPKLVDLSELVPWEESFW